MVTLDSLFKRNTGDWAAPSIATNVANVGSKIEMGAYSSGKRQRKIHTIDNISRPKKHIPKVSCLFGRRGDGKTLALSVLAGLTKRRNEKAGISFAVLSNYQLTFADVASQSLVHDLQEFPDWLDNWDYKLILIDEIAEIVPSARGGSTNNMLTVSFLKMIRKLGCSVLCATQFPQEVSHGLLRQVDFFIRCKSLRDGRSIDTFWWDWPGNLTGNWGRKWFPPEPDTHDWYFRLHNTDRFWGTYRTEEVIAPHHVRDEKMIEIREREAEKGQDFFESAREGGEAEVSGGNTGEVKQIGNVPGPIIGVLLNAPGSGSGVVLLGDIQQDLSRVLGAAFSDEQSAQMLRAYGLPVGPSPAYEIDIRGIAS